MELLKSLTIRLGTSLEHGRLLNLRSFWKTVRRVCHVYELQSSVQSLRKQPSATHTSVTQCPSGRVGGSRPDPLVGSLFVQSYRGPWVTTDEGVGTTRGIPQTSSAATCVHDIRLLVHSCVTPSTESTQFQVDVSFVVYLNCHVCGIM